MLRVVAAPTDTLGRRLTGVTVFDPLVTLGGSTDQLLLAVGVDAGAAASAVVIEEAAAHGFTILLADTHDRMTDEIRVVAGSTVTLDWWTQDAAMHLQGGVHTMIAPDLSLYETLRAESSRTISWTVPDKPGTYDVYCDSCCGGKDSPTMHGKIVVEPASATLAGPALG